MVQTYSNMEMRGCATVNVRLVVGTTPTLLGLVHHGSVDPDSLLCPATMIFGSYLARLVVQLVVEILLVGRAKEVEPVDARVNALPSLK